MDELQNTARNYHQVEEVEDDSAIRRVLVDIERLIAMLSNDLDQNASPNFSPGQQLKVTPSLYCHSTSSTTITNVTINDDSHRLIEHLRHRIDRLEHERNVLLTSYQLLIKLLK